MLKTLPQKLESLVFLTRKEVETLALNNIIGSVRKNSQTLKGYCVIASHIFSKVSNNLGYDVKIIKGKYCILGSFSMNPDNQNYHFWNEYNDLIIDLTASQFISDKIYCVGLHQQLTMNQITLEKIIDVTRTELEDFSKRV